MRHLLADKAGFALWYCVWDLRVSRVLPCCRLLFGPRHLSVSGQYRDNSWIWETPPNTILTILPRVGTRKRWTVHSPQENVCNFLLAGHPAAILLWTAPLWLKDGGEGWKAFLISACSMAVGWLALKLEQGRSDVKTQGKASKHQKSLALFVLHYHIPTAGQPSWYVAFGFLVLPQALRKLQLTGQPIWDFS